MVSKNLNNEFGGKRSPQIAFRTDTKTRSILDDLTEKGINKSEFIRESILKNSLGHLNETSPEEIPTSHDSINEVEPSIHLTLMEQIVDLNRDIAELGNMNSVLEKNLQDLKGSSFHTENQLRFRIENIIRKYSKQKAPTSKSFVKVLKEALVETS